AKVSVPRAALRLISKALAPTSSKVRIIILPLACHSFAHWALFLSCCFTSLQAWCSQPCQAHQSAKTHTTTSATKVPRAAPLIPQPRPSTHQVVRIILVKFITSCSTSTRAALPCPKNQALKAKLAKVKGADQMRTL